MNKLKKKKNVGYDERNEMHLNVVNLKEVRNIVHFQIKYIKTKAYYNKPT